MLLNAGYDKIMGKTREDRNRSSKDFFWIYKIYDLPCIAKKKE